MPSNSASTMPVFRALKSRPMFFGLGIPEFLAILTILGVGVGLFFLSGLWTHKVMQPISQAEALVELSELQALQSSVVKAEQLFAATGAAAVTDIDLSSADAAAYTKAVSLGIGSETTRDELVAMVPETVGRTQPVVPDVLRGIVLIAAPTLIAFGFLIEYSPGQNGAKDLCRLTRNARKQHIYVTDPKRWMEESLRA